MILPVFIAATVATSALAVVMLVRGLRATTRAGCGERAAWCVLLAIIQGGVMVASYLAGLSAAFAAVASADPSEKANLLSANISAVARIGSIGMLASLPPGRVRCRAVRAQPPLPRVRLTATRARSIRSSCGAGQLDGRGFGLGRRRCRRAGRGRADDGGAPFLREREDARVDGDGVQEARAPGRLLDALGAREQALVRDGQRAAGVVARARLFERLGEREPDHRLPFLDLAQPVQRLVRGAPGLQRPLHVAAPEPRA